MNALQYKRWQQTFLASFCSFSLFLFAMAFYRSSDRQSLLSGVFSTDTPSTSIEDSANANSALHVQEFNRVEVKNGRKLWEVRGLEAKYYPTENLVHVNNAHVVVYQKKGSPITFNSKAAKLILNNDSIDRAEMEGEVVIKLGNSFLIRTSSATYDTAMQEFNVPREVEIDGAGFQVKGVNLKLLLEDQQIILEQDVWSKFESGAKVPEMVNFSGNSSTSN